MSKPQLKLAENKSAYERAMDEIDSAWRNWRGIEAHCHHNPFDETDPALVAILGSRECADRWITAQRALLN
jgi:hypothetical protein